MCVFPDSGDLTPSVSKIPTRGQRSSSKVKSRKESPPENSPSTTAFKDSVSNRNTKTETAVKASKSVTADQAKHSQVSDEGFIFKRLSTEEEERKTNLTHNQSSTSDIKQRRKEMKEIEVNITSPVSKIQAIPNDNTMITENMQAKFTPASGLSTEVLLSSEVVEASPSQSPVPDVSKVVTDSQAGQRETKQQTKAESPPENVSRIQGDNSTLEGETLFSQEICTKDLEEKDILGISNLKPDTKQEKAFTGPNHAVSAQDTIPAHGDVTDMSAKPVAVGSIHSDIMAHSDQEVVMPCSAFLKKTDEVISEQSKTINILPANFAPKNQDVKPSDALSATPIAISLDVNLARKQPQIDQSIILENDSLPTFSTDSKNFKEEESIKMVGRKPGEGLDIQTETVIVSESLKNVENQLDKEPLLLAGEFEKQPKDSKPNERLNDPAVQNTDSQDNCKKQLNNTITTEDRAENDVPKPEKPTHLSSEETLLKPYTEEEPEIVVTDAREEEIEAPQARSARRENTASLIDTMQECGIQNEEYVKSVAKETDEQIKPLIMQNEEEPKILLTKHEDATCIESNQENTQAANENQTPESLSIETLNVENYKEEKETRKTGEILPSEILNETTDTDFICYEKQMSLRDGHRDENIKNTEENTKSKYASLQIDADRKSVV